MSEAGFANIRQCLPAKETYSQETFKDCLPGEEESDFISPHTLMIEAEKPITNRKAGGILPLAIPTEQRPLDALAQE